MMVICMVRLNLGPAYCVIAAAHDGAHLVVGQVADFKNAALLALDQKHGLVADFGVHGGGHADLEHAFGHRCGLHAQLDVHVRLLLVEQDGGRVGLLQRSLFQVNTLNLEHGGLGGGGDSGIGHGKLL
jgi:hypothetical protein